MSTGAISPRNKRILEMRAANPGMSAAQLARLVGDGCTRNMVLGLLNRRGLNNAQVAAFRPYSEADRLDAGCRYILGHVYDVMPDGTRRPGQWRYCQAARQQGSSYCAYHHGLCYRAAPEAPKTLEAA